jgi:hypothetical protein
MWANEKSHRKSSKFAAVTPVRVGLKDKQNVPVTTQSAEQVLMTRTQGWCVCTQLEAKACVLFFLCSVALLRWRTYDALPTPHLKEAQMNAEKFWKKAKFVRKVEAHRKLQNLWS